MRDQLLQGPEGESPHDFASYDYLRGPVGLPLSPVLEATRGPSRGGVDDDDMASADANVKHELDGGHLAPPPSSASKGKMKSKMKGQSLGPGADDGGGGGAVAASASASASAAVVVAASASAAAAAAAAA